MARLGGLFHAFRNILKQCEEKPLFRNGLGQFRREFQSATKNSTAQNWHKAAQKFGAKSLFVRVA
jgi:hypothetical protein